MTPPVPTQLREDLKGLDTELKALLASYNVTLVAVPFIAPNGTTQAQIAYADIEDKPAETPVGKLQDAA